MASMLCQPALGQQFSVEVLLLWRKQATGSSGRVSRGSQSAGMVCQKAYRNKAGARRNSSFQPRHLPPPQQKVVAVSYVADLDQAVSPGRGLCSTGIRRELSE